MIVRNVAKQIHDSDIFGTLVELGPNPVSYRLLEVKDASKTVYTSLSPYNKKAQVDLFFDGVEPEMRSVSKEYVDHVMTQYLTPESEGAFPENHNMIYVSSFQIGDGICNHGWVAYKYEHTYRLYHLTLPDWFRGDVISELGRVGMYIILNRNADVAIPYCDILLNGSFIKDEHELPVQAITNMMMQSSTGKYKIKDQPLTFNRNGTMCRLETILREFESGLNHEDSNPPTIPIYKGSFNPLHNLHKAAAQAAQDRYTHPTIFMISLDTHQKNQVDPYQIYKRIRIINRLGYHVIVMRGGLYNEAIDLLRTRTDRKFVWISGADSINRLADMTDPSVEQSVLKADFFAINRPGIAWNRDLPFGSVEVHEGLNMDVSSTEIRKLLDEGDTEGLAKLIPYSPTWL